MVERSLVSFVVLFTAMAFVTSVWQVLALRAIQGLFAGYGSLSVAMAAESAPRERMPSAIGAVQTAQRIGPGVGPVIGGLLAGFVGLRRAFVATALFYLVALVIVHAMYDDRAIHAQPADAADTGQVTFATSGVQEFHPAADGDLRAAVRRSQLRPGAAVVRRAGRRHPRQRADRVRRALLDHGVHRRARPSLLRQAAESERWDEVRAVTHRLCEPDRDRRRRRGGGRRGALRALGNLWIAAAPPSCSAWESAPR
jgi:hypothetical protein